MDAEVSAWCRRHFLGIYLSMSIEPSNSPALNQKIPVPSLINSHLPLQLLIHTPYLLVISYLSTLDLTPLGSVGFFVLGSSPVFSLLTLLTLLTTTSLDRTADCSSARTNED